MRILVTGGAGMIGSHLVDLLLANGHEVTVFDSFATGRWENLTTAWGGQPTPPPSGVSMSKFWVRSPNRPLTVQPGTVTWSANVTDIMALARPEVVFHLAAQIDVQTSVTNPEVDADVNVMGTLRMLQAAVSAEVRRFVFVSSAAMFGDRGAPRSLRAGADGFRAVPISPYGASKAAAALYVDLYDRMGAIGHHSMTASTVVLSNVYGPRQRPSFGAVNLFTRKLLTGEPVTLYGDGQNVRDYVYVTDAAAAIAAAGGTLQDTRGHLVPPLLSEGRMLVGTGVGTTDDALLTAVTAEVVRQARPTPTHRPAARMPARAADIRSMVFPRHPLAATPLTDGLRLTVEAIRGEMGL